MKLVCYSVSFHEAPLEAREKLAFSDDQQRVLLGKLRDRAEVFESMVLCTCNRTEVYLSCGRSALCGGLVEEILGQVAPSALESWRLYRRERVGQEAIRHLFTVAAGLDSQMLGEHQIISQLKSAYRTANEEKMTQFFFHRLMHRTFRASKEVRSRTDLQSGSVSIGAAAVELAWKQLSLPGAAALLLGAGENAELVGKLLVKLGIGRLWIASRRRPSAERLASGLKFGEPIELDQAGSVLGQADLAICTTGSPEPMITTARDGYLLSQRTRPIVLIDIAVPRDVEPEVGQLDGVRLFNLDDLNQQVNEKQAIRAEQALLAGEIVAEHVRRFAVWLDSLEVADVVAELADMYTALAEKETRRYRRYFQKEEHAQLERFAQSLVRKVLHGPISYLKESRDQELRPDQMQAIDFVRKMLLAGSEAKKKSKS